MPTSSWRGPGAAATHSAKERLTGRGVTFRAARKPPYIAATHIIFHTRLHEFMSRAGSAGRSEWTFAVWLAFSRAFSKSDVVC